MQGILRVKLKKARKEHGFSQGSFAQALGLLSEFTSDLETDRRAPFFATFMRCCSLEAHEK